MKVGDKIACISTPDNILKINNIYTISKVERYNYSDFFTLDEIREYVYPKRFFITIVQFRKNKLDKLNRI